MTACDCYAGLDAEACQRAMVTDRHGAELVIDGERCPCACHEEDDDA